MVILTFSWVLCCQFPFPHSEPQPTSASTGGPPIPLGRSLVPLWALKRQLRLLPGWTPMCTCPQNAQLRLEQSQLWEHSLSIQIFLGLPRRSWGFNPPLVQLHREIPSSSSLVTHPLRLSFGFGPISACGPPSGNCSLPRWEGVKAAADWVTLADWGTYLLRPGRDKTATTGACTKCLQWQRLAGNSNWLGCTRFDGSLFQSPQRHRMAGGEGGCNGGPAPCTPLSNDTSFPRQTMLPLVAFLSVDPLTPILSGCLCTANSSPLLESALLTPHFSTQPLPALVASCFRLWRPRLIPSEVLAWVEWTGPLGPVWPKEALAVVADRTMTHLWNLVEKKAELQTKIKTVVAFIFLHIFTVTKDLYIFN